MARLGAEVAAECDPRFRLLSEHLEVEVGQDSGEEVGLKGYVKVGVPVPGPNLSPGEILNIAEEMAFESARAMGYEVRTWRPEFSKRDTLLKLYPEEYELVVDREAEAEEIRAQERDDERRGK